MSSLSNDLAAVVGADAVLDPAPGFYRSDATEAAGLKGTPDAVVLPADAEEVAAVVAYCYREGLVIVPRGGGTGFAGGRGAVRRRRGARPRAARPGAELEPPAGG